MSNAHDEPMVVIYADYELYEDAKFFGSVREWVTRVDKLDPELLARRLAGFARQFQGILDDVKESTSAFHLDQFEVTLDVTAKGELRLIGAVGTEVKGGLKLRFSRRTSDA